jgi:hypothetical protein
MEAAERQTQSAAKFIAADVRPRSAAGKLRAESPSNLSPKFAIQIFSRPTAQAPILPSTPGIGEVAFPHDVGEINSYGEDR